MTDSSWFQSTEKGKSSVAWMVKWVVQFVVVEKIEKIEKIEENLE